MIKSGINRATKQFFLTTTLHGFKYLCSGFHTDRICWLCWCAGSACCAGALCAVLWARFLQVPALLALRPAPAPLPLPLPTVAVCLPARSAARLLVGHLSTDKDVVRKLILAFSRILEGKEAQKGHLLLIEQLLVANNVTVLEALYRNMPQCLEFTRRCRWQDTMIPCELLFHRQLTQFGVCCVMQPNKIKNKPPEQSIWDNSKRLDLVLQCSNKSLFYGCQFFTQYPGQESVSSAALAPGSAHVAQLSVASVQDGGDDQLVGGCVADELYSWTHCMEKCMERLCRCSNPLRTIYDDEVDVPPPCQVSRINCLRRTEKSSCNCMPSCSKLSTDLSIEDSPMKSVRYTVDPLYSGVNVSESTVLYFRVLLDGSRIFTRQPTETWFTLLSSLGGVFNMFLGVGLFSALEFFFFLLVRVPAAINHLPETDVSVTHVHSRHQ